jgi:hypothetical protein
VIEGGTGGWLTVQAALARMCPAHAPSAAVQVAIETIARLAPHLAVVPRAPDDAMLRGSMRTLTAGVTDNRRRYPHELRVKHEARLVAAIEAGDLTRGDR